MRVCLTCRRPLPGDLPCDLPDHAALEIDAHTPAGGAGRDALVALTWGSPLERDLQRRKRFRKHERTAAAAGVGFAAGAAAAWSFVSPYAAGACGLVGAVGAAVVAGNWHKAGALDRFPVPAPPLAPAPLFARGMIVAASEELHSPTSGLPGVGWALSVSLRCPGGPRVLFRDAEVAALEIALESGHRARAPAGPWRPADEPPPLDEIEETELTAHLRGVDPFYQPDDPVAPFHHDTAHEELLQVGDRVELRGAWVPDGPIFVPVAWPTLRRLRG